MESTNQTTPIENNAAPAPVTKKPAAGKLPSKPISFANQANIKNGKKVKTSVDKSKKSGHLMKKLTGK